ncbi:MAG: hypothetical protein WBK54_03435 [Bacilli bacterium]
MGQFYAVYNKEEKYQRRITFLEDDQNTWYVAVDYSYSSTIATCFAVSQKSSGTFKFGSIFYVVDSLADEEYSYVDYWIT